MFEHYIAQNPASIFTRASFVIDALVSQNKIQLLVDSGENKTFLSKKDWKQISWELSA